MLHIDVCSVRRSDALPPSGIESCHLYPSNIYSIKEITAAGHAEALGDAVDGLEKEMRPA
jgi:hypothetical protein